MQLDVKKRGGIGGLSQKIREMPDRRPLLFTVSLALAVTLLIETASRHSLVDGVVFLFSRPVNFLTNLFIVLATVSLGHFFKRRAFFLTLFTGIWLGLGIANGVVLAFRMTPLTFTDLRVLPSVFSIMGVYLEIWQIVLILLAFVLVLAGLVVLFLKAPKRRPRYRMATAILASSVLLSVGAYSLTVVGHREEREETFSYISDAYDTYGFVYCFATGAVDVGIDKPDFYSRNAVERLVGSLGETSAPARRPNIIMVQLESFFDVSYLSDVEYEKDPIPNFTRLKESFSSGFLTVPSVGAGTANTEFEVLSGMSLDFFGMGEYPYKTILAEEACETVVRDLAALGYTGTAIHNNTGTFYGRNEVFAQLGFDNFTSIEYMENVEYNPIGWARDHVLTEEILKALDATGDQDFVFAITVQGHGKYQRGVDSEEAEHLGVTWADNPEAEEAFAYYVSQLQETDAFIGELLDALSRRNEPTMVVFYGDHLPNFNIGSDQLENGDIFETEYVIWNNFGLPKNDGDIYAYQLAAKTLGEAGISSGLLMRYHQQMAGKEDYLDGLRLLEYDMLYGDFYSYGGENPYTATDLHMGVGPIVLMDTKWEEEGLTVRGEGFTPWSRVTVDGEELETVFLDGRTLVCPMSESPKDGAVIGVRQVTASSAILSESVGLIWRGV